MSFSYFDNDKKLQKVDIQVGANWSDYKVSNEKLSSIFNEIDDGDGIVQLTEKIMLDNLIKQADNQFEATANNNILENEELDKFDVKTGILQQSYDKNNFTLDAIKAAYPEDRYTYVTNQGSVEITDKESGKLVVSYSEIHDGSRDLKFVNEFTNTNKKYSIYENQRDNNSKIELSNTDNVFLHEVSIEFNGGNIRSYEKGNLKLYGENAITQNILLSNLDNPEWMKNDAIEFINNIPAKDLLEIIKKYNEDNKSYLLDKLNASKDIPKKAKEEFIANTLKRLEEAAGYDPQMKDENSQVKNNFYQSPNTYSISYDNDIITIKQTGGKKKAKDQKIDLNKLVSNLPLDMQPITKATLQQLPAEALMDLAIEADRFDSPANGTKISDNQAGLFSPNNDRISFGYGSLETVRPDVIAHELGHAIDCNNKGNGQTYSTKDNKNFIQAFNNAVKQWNANPKPTDRLYILTSPQEAFAELYSFSMYGASSASTPEAITPELLTEFQNQLASIREMKTDARHKREK